MKHARIAWAGAIHHAIERDGRLELLTPAFKNRLLDFGDVVWLPPLAPMPPHRPRTVLALASAAALDGMNATAALDIPPCRRYVIVKATAGFAVFRLILKSLLFYSCLDFTQNLGKTHFCLTFGVHFSIRSLFFGIFFNVFAIGIYSFDSCFLSTAWIS